MALSYLDNYKKRVLLGSNNRREKLVKQAEKTFEKQLIESPSSVKVKATLPDEINVLENKNEIDCIIIDISDNDIKAFDQKYILVRKDEVRIQSNVTRTLTTNNTYIIEPSEGFDAMSKATIDVNVPQSSIQLNKNVTITSNTTTNISPDSGYDGIRSVSVVTNVPSNNETWVNKRFTTNNTYTISNVMNDNTKDGVSKDSTFIVDVLSLLTPSFVLSFITLLIV